MILFLAAVLSGLDAQAFPSQDCLEELHLDAVAVAARTASPAFRYPTGDLLPVIQGEVKRFQAQAFREKEYVYSFRSFKQDYATLETAFDAEQPDAGKFATALARATFYPFVRNVPLDPTAYCDAKMILQDRPFVSNGYRTGRDYRKVTSGDADDKPVTPKERYASNAALSAFRQTIINEILDVWHAAGLKADQKRREAAEKVRREREEAEARAKAEEEQRRIAAQKAERERKEAEARAKAEEEQRRIAAQKAERERKEAEARAKAEEEQRRIAAQKAERERKEAEARAKAEEEQRRIAAQKAERERKEAEARAKAEEEQRRIAAQKAEREQEEAEAGARVKAERHSGPAEAPERDRTGSIGATDGAGFFTRALPTDRESLSCDNRKVADYTVLKIASNPQGTPLSSRFREICLDEVMKGTKTSADCFIYLDLMGLYYKAHLKDIVTEGEIPEGFDCSANLVFGHYLVPIRYSTRLGPDGSPTLTYEFPP